MEFVRAIIERDTDAKVVDAAKISLAQIREKVKEQEITA